MSEFKFSCPRCKQRMQARAEWVGRKVSCPTCKSDIAIPSAPPPPSNAPLQSRVAALTPKIKVDIVRAVRERISDKTKWIPGLSKTGKVSYAAKREDGKATPVNAASRDATCFSLVGAFLKEFSFRNVVSNAPGRRRLLDDEIPNAIRTVVFGGDSEYNEPERSDKDLLSISHAQCLEVLDYLEEQFATAKSEARAVATAKKFGKTRLNDLVRKLEKKTRILPEDIVVSLINELGDLQDRLQRLERRLPSEKLSESGKSKRPAPASVTG